MKNILFAILTVACCQTVLFSSASENTRVTSYPFADAGVIDWQSELGREQWEARLSAAGITIERVFVARPELKKMAHHTECNWFRKGGDAVGYGLILISLSTPIHAVNDETHDQRVIAVSGIEVISDMLGNRVILVSYETLGLSWFEKKMARLLGHKPDARRRVIDQSNLDLGQGYRLSDEAKIMLETIIIESGSCKPR